MKIVVVSPHRDDAAFSLGLAIEAWLASGHQVTVLNCFTRSGYAPYSDVESLHANDRVSFVSAIRRREDIAWAKLAGTGLSFHDLDLLDAPLRLACSEADVQTIGVRPGDRAVARLMGAIAKLVRISPAGHVAIAVPLAVGEHIDHRVAQQAAVDALAGSRAPLAFYEDLPYAGRRGASETPSDLVRRIGLDFEPCFAVARPADVAGATSRKIKIAECYDSQVDSEAVRSIAEFTAVYDGRERLWANTAWRNADLCAPAEMKA